MSPDDLGRETENIVACLRFLEKEAARSHLPAVSLILSAAIAHIASLDPHDASCPEECDFAELMQLFRVLALFFIRLNSAIH